MCLGLGRLKANFSVSRTRLKSLNQGRALSHRCRAPRATRKGCKATSLNAAQKACFQPYTPASKPSQKTTYRSFFGFLLLQNSPALVRTRWSDQPDYGFCTKVGLPRKPLAQFLSSAPEHMRKSGRIGPRLLLAPLPTPIVKARPRKSDHTGDIPGQHG